MNPFLKVLIPLFLSICLNQVFGQSCFDEIADKEIPIESLSNPNGSSDLSEFLENFYCFIGEELDSIDIEILSEGPYLGVILFDDIGKEPQAMTYRRLKELMIAETKELGYSQMRDLHLLTRNFSRLPALYENWESDKQALLNLGIPEEKLEPFENYLKTHSDSTKNYEQVMNEFELSKAENWQAPEEGAENTILELQLEELLKNNGVINLDSLVIESNRKNKPILLYFTGYSATGGRKLERVVLDNKEIIQSLHDEFLFAAVYVDDRRELPENQKRYSETLKQTIKTIGDKNVITQIELCNIASQPYFVGLNDQKEVLGTGEYADFKSAEDFLTFLAKVKSEFAK